jgi:hypothetical protein
MAHSAVAAIQYAIDKCEDDGDAMQFLGYWNNGDFDVIRRNWPDVPEAVFADADPLHKQYKKKEEDAGEVMAGLLDCIKHAEELVGGGLPGHLLIFKNEHSPTVLDVVMPDQDKYLLTLSKQ